jgi:hypothetical protein
MFFNIMSHTLTWSNGTVAEKSPRQRPESSQPIKTVENIELNAVAISENKRELSYSKMAERELISQINLNPFMPQNTYSDALLNNSGISI